MRPRLLKDTLLKLYRTKRAVHIEGPPGGGKTQLVEQVADELGVQFIHKHIPTMLVEDFSIPMPEGDAITHKVVDWYPRDVNSEGILLYDEMPQGGNDLQKLIANQIQERELHGHKLPDGWQIVMTGNRISDRAGANRILSHLRNRMTVLSFDTHIDDWTAHAMASGVRPEVIALNRMHPNLLHDYHPNREGNPSPRAWIEGVSDVMGSIPKEAEYEVFAGAVGEAAASEFMAMLKTSRTMPNIETILTSPTTAQIPAEGDAFLMTCYALSGALSHRADVDNFSNILTYLTRLPNDFNVLTVTLAMRKNKDLAETGAFTQWASTVGNDVLF